MAIHVDSSCGYEQQKMFSSPKSPNKKKVVLGDLALARLEQTVSEGVGSRGFLCVDGVCSFRAFQRLKTLQASVPTMLTNGLGSTNTDWCEPQIQNEKRSKRRTKTGSVNTRRVLGQKRKVLTHQVKQGLCEWFQVHKVLQP
jgi:hypothetical protein